MPSMLISVPSESLTDLFRFDFLLIDSHLKIRSSSSQKDEALKNQPLFMERIIQNLMNDHDIYGF